MKILIVTQYFWPENFRVNDLCIGLKERGHEITVITGLPNYPKGDFFKGYNFFSKRNEIWEDIKIIRCKLFPRKNGSAFFLVLNYMSFAFFSTLTILFLTAKFDNIIVYQLSPGTVGFPGIVAKYKFKAPLSFYIQDIWPESLNDAGNIRSKSILKIFNSMMNFFYKHSDKILVQSEPMIDFLIEKGLPQNKLTYIPNTVETFYKPLKPLKQFKSQFPKGFNILFAGNIGQAQDFDTIIYAALILKEKSIKVNFVIIGEGRAKKDLIDKTFDLGLSSYFHFIGIRPSAEIPNYFSCADVLLVSLKESLIFSLTIPSKIQSYLACKKPIIANISGIGAKIIIDSNSGFVSQSGNYQMLANNIENMLNLNNFQKNNFAINGYNYFQSNFDRTIIYDKLEKHLNLLYS